VALGEYTIQSETVINRRPQEVFEFVANSENDPQWCHLVPEVTRIGDDESGLATYRFIQRFGPTRSDGTVQVVSMSPPSELHSVTTVMGGVFHTSYRLEPANGNTRFVHTNEVSWSGAMRLMHPIQKPMTRRIMDRQLGALKSILEVR
jgi:uncharacterized protein YndB with AHSA1/START domain